VDSVLAFDSVVLGGDPRLTRAGGDFVGRVGPVRERTPPARSHRLDRLVPPHLPRQAVVIPPCWSSTPVPVRPEARRVPGAHPVGRTIRRRPRRNVLLPAQPADPHRGTHRESRPRTTGNLVMTTPKDEAHEQPRAWASVNDERRSVGPRRGRWVSRSASMRGTGGPLRPPGGDTCHLSPATSSARLVASRSSAPNRIRGSPADPGAMAGRMLLLVIGGAAVQLVMPTAAVRHPGVRQEHH